MLDVAAGTKSLALPGQDYSADGGVAGDARTECGDFLAVRGLRDGVAFVGTVERGRDDGAVALDDQEGIPRCGFPVRGRSRGWFIFSTLGSHGARF
jgi:hypothetical protein